MPSGSAPRPRGSLVLIASPDAAVRRWWKSGVPEAFAAEEAADLPALRRALTAQRPSVVLVDLALPRLSRIRGVADLVRLAPSARFVVMAERPDDREAVEALKAGALGYCGRSVETPLIGKMMEAIQKGELWVRRGVMLALLRELIPPPTDRERRRGGGIDARLQPLTPREREIAYLVSAGAKNKDIAVSLSITETTVKAHLTAIFRKLGIPDRLRLALMISEGDRLDQERHGTAEPDEG